jgi:lysophospholipase L1-like esterase
LRETLGASYEVIEEGLNGRTTVWDDPIEGYKNGREYLIPCLDTHRPLDLVIILLGTNDLKKRFSLSAFDVAEGAGVLVRTVQKSEAGIGGNPPAILLLAPPPIGRLSAEYFEMFEGAEEKSRHLGAHFLRVGAMLGCAVLDTSQVIVSSNLDGIHFEQSQHRKLGEAIARRVKEMLD